MSSRSRRPSDHPADAEIEQIDRFATIARRGLKTYARVRNALADIRDERLRLQAAQALSRDSRASDCVCGDQLSQALDRHDVLAAELCLTVQKRPGPVGLVATATSKPAPANAPQRDPNHPPPAEPPAGELLSQLRWLLTQSSGTLADAMHRLEPRAADLDDSARAQLRHDAVVLGEELATLKLLLARPVDWDAEYGRLLGGEIPPIDQDVDEGEHA